MVMVKSVLAATDFYWCISLYPKSVVSAWTMNVFWYYTAWALQQIAHRPKAGQYATDLTT